MNFYKYDNKKSNYNYLFHNLIITYSSKVWSLRKKQQTTENEEIKFLKNVSRNTLKNQIRHKRF